MGKRALTTSAGILLACLVVACGGGGDDGGSVAPGGDGGDPGNDGGGNDGGGNDGGGNDGGGDPPDPPQDVDVTTLNPILFVTQVPDVNDYLNVCSTFGNHDGRIRNAPRGGDLWIRYGNGTLRNLTQEAGYGSDGFQGDNSIAVREPCVHFDADRALFSMVVGSPTQQLDLDTKWQIYEISGFLWGQTVQITKVPNQPENYNNVSPIYATDGRILFTSDMPMGGAHHLHPQLDEYESAPTNTGLWSLDPVTGETFLMNHSPSGVFTPQLDTFGRVVFTRWDHLERDQQKDLEAMGQGNYNVFNYSGEEVGSFNTGSDDEVFPEARGQWVNYVNQNGWNGDLNGYEPHLTGNGFNDFNPWMINQDGSEEETLNHVGRHELHSFIDRVRTDDPVLGNHNLSFAAVANRKYVNHIFQMSEDPWAPGSYLGTDCRRFDTHGAGQIVRINANPLFNADQVTVDWVTHPDTKHPTLNPSSDHSGLYRDPVRLVDEQALASHTYNTLKDANIGSSSHPQSRYDFRLTKLVWNGEYYTAGPRLTDGIWKSISWNNPYNLVHFAGNLWELDAVEVQPRFAPVDTSEPALKPEEAQAISNAGVSEQALRNYLRQNELALIVTRDVTSRDDEDRQQPYNLRVPSSGHSRLANTGRVYDVSHLQLFQGDRIRSMDFHGPHPLTGRRVLAQPLHDPAAMNPPSAGAPPGGVKIADDGSMAALVPARRAMSWQLTAPDHEPIVRERYWISFQPGEIRTCHSCHGVNQTNQVNQGPPENVPQALTELLDYLESVGEL